MRPFVVLLLCSLCASADPAAWKRDFQAKRRETGKWLGPRHLDLGRRLAKKKAHAWAAAEFRRAVAWDDSLEAAHLALGHVRQGSRWIENPTATRRANDLTEAGEISVAGFYRGARRGLAIVAVTHLERLAAWANSRFLDDEAASVWREVLYYEPEHRAARLALGWVEKNGGWIDPRDVERRKAIELRVAAAPEGSEAACGGTTTTTSLEGVRRRCTKHFHFEGLLDDSDMKSLMRTAEASRAMFLETFEMSEARGPGLIRGVFVRNQQDHEIFLDSRTDITGLERDMFRVYPSWTTWDPPTFEARLAPYGVDHLADRAVHETIHFHFARFAGLPETPAWLWEGTAVWFTDLFSMTAYPRCVEAIDRDPTPVSTVAWRKLVFQAARDNTYPSVRSIMRRDLEAMSPQDVMFAWSFTDYILAKRRPSLYAYLAALRKGDSRLSALRTAFGVAGYDAFGDEWRRFVLESY